MTADSVASAQDVFSFDYSAVLEGTRGPHPYGTIAQFAADEGG
jgi:hypothetical protein